MEEEDRRWLEKFFKSMYTESGIGIVIKGIDGRMLDCNPAFRTMLGYSSEEIQTHTYLDITHPLDRPYARQLFNELVSGKRKNYILEKRYLASDGQTVWVRINVSAVYNTAGAIQFIIAMVENITTKKQIEEELNEMRRRLMQGRELERLKLAQDLHDGPLQEIIGVIFQVESLENSNLQENDKTSLQAIQASLHQLSDSIRNICGELRPPTLIPFGLEKAIRSHIDGFRSAHPEINVNLDLAQDGRTLAENPRIVLFRIFQETLNNVVRHSQASEVNIRFALDQDEASLEIKDNGIGFELPTRWIRLARQGHLGLVGSLERIEEIGGNLVVTTAPAQGTTILASIPLDEENLEKVPPRQKEEI